LVLGFKSIIATSLKKLGISSSEQGVTWVAISLATVAALFPWYVFFNADKFAGGSGDGDRTRDLPHTGPREVFSVSPMAMTNRNKDNDLTFDLPPDPLTTATISNKGKVRQSDHGAVPQDQPFPGKSNFRLLHVANGRALIEDNTGMYMLKVGSVLPDETMLTKIEQRDGEWMIESSNGVIYYTEN
jgi:hypothetical protein